MQDIMDKAKELGIMIAESEEFKAYKLAEANQLDDKEAVELMMEYHTTRENLTKKASNPDITKEEFEVIQNEAKAAFEKIMNNKSIAAYVDAQQNFSNLMNKINGILGYYVSGKDSEGGCSGSCSTCGGCHH